MSKRLYPEGHPDLLESERNCAYCLTFLGRHAEALTNYEEALDLRRRLYPGDRQDVADALRDLAVCLTKLDRHEEALPRFEESLAMYRVVVSEDDIHVAGGLNYLADCLCSLGRPEEGRPHALAAESMAARLLPEAHGLRRKIAETLRKLDETPRSQH
jgi:tetratricopeptide (TPR) repeat protein